MRTFKLLNKWVVFIITIGVFILIKNIKTGYFIDIFNISSINASEYFGLIIGATASIFGILIAVVLLTYELLTTKKQEESFFESNYIINIFFVPISILILSFVSYINVKDFNQVNSLSIAYYIGFLFILFLLGLFWSIKKILDELKTKKKLVKDINRITFDNIKEILPRLNEKFIFKNSDILLIKIREELIQYIREYDYNAFSSILEELNKKSIELISQGNDRMTADSVFQVVKSIWEAGNLEAIRVGNLKYFEAIWGCIEEFYEFAAKNKTPLVNYKILNFFVRDYIQFLIRKKLPDGLTKGIDSLIKSFKINLLENCPPEEKVSDLFFAFENGADIPYYVNESIQWDEIEEFLYNIFSIFVSSIEIQDKELFDYCRFKTEHIIEEITFGTFNNLGVLQEAAIVSQIISEQTYLAFEANERQIYKDTGGVFRIRASRIAELIGKERIHLVKRILGDISDFIINSQKKKRVHAYFTLNYWGAIVRHVTQIHTINDLAKQSIFYILKTFSQLKIIIETDQLPYESKNYNEIKKQVESIKRSLIKKDPDYDKETIGYIDKLLESFKKTKGDDDFRIVKWDDA